jgi:hypothetical protein
MHTGSSSQPVQGYFPAGEDVKGSETFGTTADANGNITFIKNGQEYNINPLISSDSRFITLNTSKNSWIVADTQGSTKNQAMLNSMTNGTPNYLGSDTEGGVAYIGPMSSYNSLDEGVSAYMSYLLNTFPDVVNATDAVSYNEAIQNGVGTPPNQHKFHDSTGDNNQKYIDGLNKISNVASGKYPPSSGDVSNTGIIAFGASTDSSDPLGPVYGRNIIANESRMQIVNEQKTYLNNQINIMHSIPPLVMLVNPSDFKRNYENLVDFSTKVRAGNVVHTWLEQPMKISCSGVSAAQYAVYADGSGGLSNYDRIQTISYMNLMSLAMIYKNNGMIFGDSGLTDEGVMILPGSVFIYYDDMLYLGSFDDFSITDNAEKPYNLEYSFNFTTRFTTEFTV